MQFVNLPPELIEAVYNALDARNIIRLSSVSRHFRSIFQRSSALEYKIQLERDDLRDGNTPPSSAARLSILNAYRAAWTSFQTVSATVKMEGNLWELVGNVLATYGPEKFSFTRISSPTKGIPPATWSIDAVPFNVTDFSLDLSQDLLLVVEVDARMSTVFVRFLSLESGRPHKLARDPCLVTGITVPHTGFPPSFQIRIFGEYAGIMVDSVDHAMTLLIWEWKTGIMKKNLCNEDMTAFAFLNSRMLLISAHSPHLLLPPELRVLEIEGPLTQMKDFLSFQLPILSLQKMPEIDMMIQTEPSPAWPGGEQPRAPFSTSHSDRLFVVSLRGWETFQAAEPTFMLCFLLSTLTNLIERCSERTFPWDTWGPSGTRMLRVPELPDPWVCFVFGQRCILHTSRTRCKILDFNPLSASPNRIAHEKTVDKRRRMFSQAVTTSASFTLSDMDIIPSEAVMLAEDGIVTVSPEEDVFTIFSV